MDPWHGIDQKSYAESCVEELEHEEKRTVITPGGRVGSDSSTGSRSNRENWVERTRKGGLPRYIRIVRNGLMREGHSESRATALAVAAIKRWARGAGNVSPKVQAAAKVAAAEWAAMKAEKSNDADETKKFNESDHARVDAGKPGGGRFTRRDGGKDKGKKRKTRKYTIQSGDTLSELAAQHNTTVDELMELNPQIDDRDLIYTGEEMNLPTKDREEDDDDKKPEDKSAGDEDMHMEYKTVGVSGLKSLDDEGEGIIEAFVSVTGLKDNVNDIIEVGAYEETLKKVTPKGVWGHDWNSPVSKTLDIKEILPGSSELPETLSDGSPWPAEAGALKVKMQFNLDGERGRQAYSDVKFFGDQQEWSIGYNVPKGMATMDTKAGARRIKGLSLYEFSPVLFGAMPQARTNTVKDAQIAYKSLQEVDIEEWLSEVKSLQEFGGETKSMPVGADLEDDDLNEINFESFKEKGVLSAENITLLKKASDVINELLTAATGVPDESKNIEWDIESKDLVDVMDAVKTAEVLDEGAVDELTTIAEDFDAAIKADDIDAAESSAEAMLDAVDDYLEDAEKDARGGLQALAGAVASILTKTFGDEDPEGEGLGDPSGADDDREEKREDEETLEAKGLDLSSFDTTADRAFLESLR